MFRYHFLGHFLAELIEICCGSLLNSILKTYRRKFLKTLWIFFHPKKSVIFYMHNLLLYEARTKISHFWHFLTITHIGVLWVVASDDCGCVSPVVIYSTFLPFFLQMSVVMCHLAADEDQELLQIYIADLIDKFACNKRWNHRQA